MRHADTNTIQIKLRIVRKCGDDDEMRFTMVSSWPSLFHSFIVVRLMGWLCSFLLFIRFERKAAAAFAFDLWGKITLWRNYIIESEINNKWIIGWKVTMQKANTRGRKKNCVRFLWHLSCHTFCYFALRSVLVTLGFLLLFYNYYYQDVVVVYFLLIGFFFLHTHMPPCTWIDGMLMFRSWEYLSCRVPNCAVILVYKHDDLIDLSSILTTNTSYTIATHLWMELKECLPLCALVAVSSFACV